MVAVTHSTAQPNDINKTLFSRYQNANIPFRYQQIIIPIVETRNPM